MNLAELGFARPFLAVVLPVFGLILRFGNVPPNSTFGLGLPWTYADPDIWARANRRLGELLLGWWVWTAIQLALGMPEEWIPAVWAPLLIVLVVSLSYPAGLYQARYSTLRVRRSPEPDRTPIPARGGWAVVLAREAVPLAAVLAPILVVKSVLGELPERIPVRWGLLEGPVDWRLRQDALDLLRHQTMALYLALCFLEGAFLVWRWLRGDRSDPARVMLTRTHWRFYFFKLAWVALLAGTNLGFVLHAMDGSPVAVYAAPGFGMLALLAGTAAFRSRHRRYSPPPGRRKPSPGRR